MSPALVGRFFAISATWEAFTYTTNVPNLLQFSSVTQSCLTLCDPMDCNPSDPSVHEIFQARILEWLAIPPPEDLPDQRLNLRLLQFLHWQVDSLLLNHLGSPRVTF